MRVGVDATSWANRRGYGRFARNVVGRLVAARGRVRPLHGRADAREEELPEGALVRAVAVGRPPRRTPLARFATSDALRRPPRVSALDVFLFPSLYTWFPVRGAPTVVGIHDVIAEQYPELTLPDSGARARWRLKRWLAVKRATKIFTVSQASRKLLAADLGVSEASLAVVPEAPDPVFGPRTRRRYPSRAGTARSRPRRALPRLRRRRQPAQGPGDAVGRLRAAGRAGAASRRRGRARRRGVPVGGPLGSPADRRARAGEPRAAHGLCLRRGSRLPLRGRGGVRFAVAVGGVRSSRRRGCGLAARPSCSATYRHIARRWRARRSTFRRAMLALWPGSSKP